MNRMIGTALVAMLALGAGWYLGHRQAPEAAGLGESAPAEKEILYWVAPMDPNFRRDAPGKSPMGMDLVPVYAGDANDVDAVTISPAVVNNLGVRTEAATVRPLWRKIEATGYVGFDETRIAHIHLRTEGWIVSLAVNAEGEQVNQGQLLFELYSPELVNAQQEYVQAVQRGDVRLRGGAEEKLRALGMAPSEIKALRDSGKVSERIKYLAPQDGIVAELNVREGMYVKPDKAIMSLADLSSVWLQAEIFESQAEWVAQGQAAEAHFDYLPGTVFSGQVDYVYPVLDPATRTLRARLRFDNPGRRLKPNMYAEVEIFGRLRPAALTIPREALIRDGDRDRVVVALGDGRFRVNEVIAGMESGQWVEILAGIGDGDQVVTSAQFLLDSEASLAGSIQRLQGEPAESEPEGPVRVFANGWLENVDKERSRIRMSHGPIEQLGWPSMTMDFKVDRGVDLGSLEEGDNVRVVLRQEHAGEFVIEQVESGAEMDADEDEAEDREQPDD